MEPLLGSSPCLQTQGEVSWTHLKSLPLKKSQAEAWHTTSRPSVGFSSIDLFQKSGGTGSSPKEMKKLFASSNILLGVQPCKQRELCPNWGQTACPSGGGCWERAKPKERAQRACPLGQGLPSTTVPWAPLEEQECPQRTGADLLYHGLRGIHLGG